MTGDLELFKETRRQEKRTNRRDFENENQHNRRLERQLTGVRKALAKAEKTDLTEDWRVYHRLRDGLPWEIQQAEGLK
jgi:hypothetical protein